MNKGDIVYNILKNRHYVVERVDPKKNLIVTRDMEFLFLDQCQLVKTRDNDGKRHNTNRNNRNSKRK